MLKKLLGLLSDAAIYGASNALSQMIGFFLLPIYTKQLSPTDYGIMSMLGIVTMVFIPIANLGITNAIFRRFNVERTEDARGRVLSTGLYGLLVSAIVLFGLCLLGAEGISEVLIGNTEGTHLVRLTLLASLITSIASIPTATLRAERRVKTIAVINVTKVVTSASVTIYLVVVARWGVAGIICGTAISDGLAAVAQFTLTAKYLRFRPSFATLRKMLEYGLPFVPQNLQAIGVALFGQYVLRKMIGLQEAGLYDVATKFAVPINFVVTAVAAAWGPYKFEIHATEKDARQIFRSIMSYYVAGLLYLWVGLSLWGPEMCRLMTEQRFHAAALLIPIVAFVRVAQGVYYMVGTGLELTDNTRSFPLVGLAGLITVVGASYLLVPQLQSVGAVVASTVGWVVMSVVIYSIAKRQFYVPYEWGVIAALAGAAMAIVGIGWVSQDLSLAVRIGIAVLFSVLYPVIAGLIFFRSAAERERMHMLFERVAKRRRPKNRSAVGGGPDLKDGAPVPSWTLEVLGSPTQNRSLGVSDGSLIEEGDTKYPVEDGIAFLVTESRDQLNEFARRFPPYPEGSTEILRPGQRHFRRYLRQFLSSLSRDSIVVDIASGEAEFAEYFSHLRYIPMDLSTSRLKRALGLKRADFAVVADIRRPPLRESTVNVITSTNTLVHFPDQEVPEIILNLMRFLKPQGLLACTIAASAFPGLESALVGHGKLVEVRGLGGPLARWWSNSIHRRANSLAGRMGLFGRPVVQAAAMGSSMISTCDRVFEIIPDHAREFLWLVVKKAQS